MGAAPRPPAQPQIAPCPRTARSTLTQKAQRLPSRHKPSSPRFHTALRPAPAWCPAKVTGEEDLRSRSASGYPKKPTPCNQVKSKSKATCRGPSAQSWSVGAGPSEDWASCLPAPQHPHCSQRCVIPGRGTPHISLNAAARLPYNGLGQVACERSFTLPKREEATSLILSSRCLGPSLAAPGCPVSRVQGSDAPPFKPTDAAQQDMESLEK